VLRFLKRRKKCLQRIGGYFPGFEIELKAEGLNLPEKERGVFTFDI